MRERRRAHAGVGGAVDQPANNAALTWHFKAPADTRIASFRAWRAVAVEPGVAGAQPAYTLNGNTNSLPDSFEGCYNGCTALGSPAAPLADASLFARSRLTDTTDLHVNAYCGGDAARPAPRRAAPRRTWPSSASTAPRSCSRTTAIRCSPPPPTGLAARQRPGRSRGAHERHRFAGRRRGRRRLPEASDRGRRPDEPPPPVARLRRRRSPPPCPDPLRRAPGPVALGTDRAGRRRAQRSACWS